LICLIGRGGKIEEEVKVASGPDTIGAVLTETGFPLEQIGLEAGATSS
jgi:hypothetical protein